MEALLTIVTGLTVRLSLPILARRGDIRVHAALIGLWEGVVLYYFTTKARRSNRYDMYLSFIIRLFIDLAVTASPLRLALIIIWTGIGMIIADISPGLYRDTGLDRAWRRVVRDLRVLRWDVLSTLKARSSTRRSRTGGAVRFSFADDDDDDTASTIISPSATSPSSRTYTATRQSTTTGYAQSILSSRSYSTTSSNSSTSTATPQNVDTRSAPRRTIAPVPGYFPGALMSETESQVSAPRSPTLSQLPPLPPSIPTSDQPSDPDDLLYASDSSDDTEIPVSINDIPDMFAGGPLEPVQEDFPQHTYSTPAYSTPAFSARSSTAPSVAPPSTSNFETPNEQVAPPESDVPEIEDEPSYTPPRVESPARWKF